MELNITHKIYRFHLAQQREDEIQREAQSVQALQRDGDVH